MENISIKVHPPWYARGTPVTNTRDGPSMALSELSLFAIGREPSARGKTKGKTRHWLTLNNTFFNTRNSVYCCLYEVLVRKTGVIVDADLSAFAEPDHVEFELLMVDADRSGDAVRSGGN